MRDIYIKLWKVGRSSYKNGLDLQDKAKEILEMEHSINSKFGGILILLEHYPVYTVGIRKYKSQINQRHTSKFIVNKDKLISLGAEYFETNRGGLITFHGPGQLVAYPIFNLRKIFGHKFIQNFETKNITNLNPNESHNTDVNFIKRFVELMINTMTMTCHSLGIKSIFSKITPSTLTGSWHIAPNNDFINIASHSIDDIKFNMKNYDEKTFISPKNQGVINYNEELVSKYFLELKPEKVGAIGVRFSNYITSHGIALNCNVDLSWYDHIDPCGLKQLANSKIYLTDDGHSNKFDCQYVTSLSQISGNIISVEKTIPYFLAAMKQNFDVFVEG
ncbi:unnamed protein product [Gordionus sp. m RMFG-2023]